MKILIFSRTGSPSRPEVLRQIVQAIDRHGFQLAVNREFAPLFERLTGRTIEAVDRYDAISTPPPTTTTMVCIGGDGTLLEGVHRVVGSHIPVTGINSGHLGFLVGTPVDRIEELFDDIAAGRLQIEERSALDVKGDFVMAGHTAPAVNEVTLQHHRSGVIAVETYVDGQMVATYRGDGLLISTPTGSTAYSLSAGGPVVDPACACLVLTPLASHNLTMRPVVIPERSRITLVVHTRGAQATLSIDNRTCTVADGARFEITKSAERIFLASRYNISFYDTLRNKMMWGIDLRE